MYLEKIKYFIIRNEDSICFYTEPIWIMSILLSINLTKLRKLILFRSRMSPYTNVIPRMQISGASDLNIIISLTF